MPAESDAPDHQITLTLPLQPLPQHHLTLACYFVPNATRNSSYISKSKNIYPHPYRRCIPVGINIYAVTDSLLLSSSANTAASPQGTLPKFVTKTDSCHFPANKTRSPGCTWSITNLIASLLSGITKKSMPCSLDIHAFTSPKIFRLFSQAASSSAAAHDQSQI
jgi:hypothetical protein